MATEIYTISTFAITVLCCILSRSAVDAGVLCYSCSLLPHQRDCDRIVECGDNEYCYGERLISDDGLIKFSSGCRSKSTCDAAPVGKRDLIPCSICCRTNYCNLETCDNPFTSNRKRCLSCKYALHPEDCNLSIQCNEDEECFTEAIIHNQEKRYRLGCVHKNQCAPRGVDQPFGRRATSDYCGLCCDGSNCNREICTGKNTAGSFNLQKPPPLQFCRDNSTSFCSTNVGRCDEPYYKFYQCPYTCRTCTGGPVVTVAPVTTVAPSQGTSTVDPDVCRDDPLAKCDNNLVCQVKEVAVLCKETCGLCTDCSRKDPIPECQCKYLDKEADLCAESEKIPDMRKFCCYYCNRKKGIDTCPDQTCDAAEKPEKDVVEAMASGISCIE